MNELSELKLTELIIYLAKVDALSIFWYYDDDDVDQLRTQSESSE